MNLFIRAFLYLTAIVLTMTSQIIIKKANMIILLLNHRVIKEKLKSFKNNKIISRKLNNLSFSYRSKRYRLY